MRRPKAAFAVINSSSEKKLSFSFFTNSRRLARTFQLTRVLRLT